MRLDGIEAFVEVIEAQSFVKAAKRLRLPPTTVGAKIARLERRLGVTLIQRTTRRLHVTEAGETYYRYCVRVVAELRAAQQHLGASVEQPTGRIRITAPTDLAQSVLPALVERFLAAYPKVSAELIITNATLDLLAEGIDLAIRDGELKDTSLVARPFFTARLCLWAAPDYVARHGLPKKPEELAEHAFVGFSSRIPNPLRLKAGRRSVSLPTDARIQCDDLESIRKYVARGNGIGLVHEAAATEDDLVRILPEFSADSSPVSLVYPAHKFVSPAVRAFIAIATEAHGIAKPATGAGPI